MSSVETGSLLFMLVTVVVALVVAAPGGVVVYDLQIPTHGKTYHGVQVRYEEGGYATGGSGVIKFKKPAASEWTIYHGEWILTNRRRADRE